jgi:DNA invertase Pin-like site-specific DNA recombinase
VTDVVADIEHVAELAGVVLLLILGRGLVVLIWPYKECGWCADRKARPRPWNRGAEYKKTLQHALDDAHAGKFSVLIVWALDRIVRTGAEEALRTFRQFNQRGCTVVSVKESWLNGSPEVQEILIAFGGWMAKRESDRRSERIKIGLAARKAEGKAVGRQPGAADRKPRKRSGYVARWERERAAAG